MELEKAYDEESDKDVPDNNVLDHIERDILRLSSIVSAEISASSSGPVSV